MDRKPNEKSVRPSRQGDASRRWPNKCERKAAGDACGRGLGTTGQGYDKNYVIEEFKAKNSSLKISKSYYIFSITKKEFSITWTFLNKNKS